MGKKKLTAIAAPDKPLTVMGDKLMEALSGPTVGPHSESGTKPSNIITIDGYYASGRDTLGQAIAIRYGFAYLNQSHVYKMLALEAGSDEGKALAQVSKLQSSQLVNIDYTDAMRTNDVERNAHRLMSSVALAEALEAKYQELAKTEPGLVAAGTSMGRHSFPQAPVRFFLMASDKKRVQRFAKAQGLQPTNPHAVNYVVDTHVDYMMGFAPRLRPAVEEGAAGQVVSSLKQADAVKPGRELRIETDNQQVLEVFEIAKSYIGKMLPNLRPANSSLINRETTAQVHHDTTLSPRPAPDNAPLIITIDGSYQSGRETLGRRLAATYGFNILSQGMVYRQLASAALEQGITDFRQSEKLVDMAAALQPDAMLNIHFSPKLMNPKTETLARELLINRDLADVISLKFMELATRQSGLVAVGTSMGREIFTTAPVRIFMDAEPSVRFSRYGNAHQMNPASDDVRYAVNDGDAIYMRSAAPVLRAQPAPGYQQHTVHSLKDIGRVDAAEEMFLNTSGLDTGRVEDIAQIFVASRLPHIKPVKPEVARKVAKNIKDPAAP